MMTRPPLVSIIVIILSSWSTLFSSASKRFVVKPVKGNHASTRRTCDLCGLSFRRVPEYEAHLAGKRHQDTLALSATPEQLWDHWLSSAPQWGDPAVNVSALTSMFHLDELSTLDLRRRENTLHPTPVVGDLGAYERARVWRYLRDAMGYGFYSELADIMVAADADEEGHVRVKELFESLEAFKILANFIVAAQRTAQQNGLPKPTRIVELACGHGLVGALLAYRFRHLDVHLYDLEKRPTFDAFLRAFAAKGHKYPGDDTTLPNLFFHEEDLANATPYIESSIVVCLHGCGAVNERAIDMAVAHAASAWAVMPCCIATDQYLGENCHINLSEDDTRYNFLCGALASRYAAQLVQAIDLRITNRPLMICGGVGLNAAASTDEGSGGEGGGGGGGVGGGGEATADDVRAAEAVALKAAARRGKMPAMSLKLS